MALLLCHRPKALRVRLAAHHWVPGASLCCWLSSTYRVEIMFGAVLGPLAIALEKWLGTLLWLGGIQWTIISSKPKNSDSIDSPKKVAVENTRKYFEDYYWFLSSDCLFQNTMVPYLKPSFTWIRVGCQFQLIYSALNFRPVCVHTDGNWNWQAPVQRRRP